MKARKRIVLILLCAALCLVLTACGDGKKSGENDDELRKITIVLDYVPNTNHTGLYAARELGYYEELGLEVEIIEPADNTVTTLIATGKGDFGISYQEDMTYALTAEDPLPVKAIATIIQHNTSGFACHAEKDIKSPRDFEGMIYAGWGAPSEAAVIEACMTADGGDFSKLDIVLSDSSGYSALIDRVDLMWFFEAWDVIAAERDGVPINYMELRALDERLDYYTPVIIAANDTLENDPELVESFLAATTRGYEYAIENPEEAAKILHEHVSTYDLDMLIESQEFLAVKYSEDADKWGYMKDSVWDNYTRFMVEYGLIDEAIAAKDCYTNEFLPK